MLNRLAEWRSGVLLWLAGYGLLWTLLPLTFNAGLPVDVVEIVAWGREWLSGLYRHPPMKTWLMEIAFQGTGRWLGSPYLLSALSFAAAQLAVYTAIRDVQARSFAFATVVLSSLIVYFGVHLPQWNANIAQLPFAALLVLALWRALDRRSSFWWLVTGAAAAGGFLAKYSFALIPLSAAALVLYDPLMRTRIRFVPAVVGVVVTCVVIAPNLLWLLNNPEATEAAMAANSRLSASGGVMAGVLSLLTVIGVTIAVAVLPAIAVFRGLSARGRVDDGNLERVGMLTRLFGVALFGPLLATIGIALATGLMVKDHWLIVNFLFLVPWLLMRVRGLSGQIAWTRSGTVFVLASIVVIALVYPVERWSHYWFADGRPVNWTPLMPGEPLAIEAKAVWTEALKRAEMPTDTPVVVVGGGVQAATVANLLPERPTWFERLDSRLSPWVTEDELRRHGVLVVGPDDTSSLVGFGLCRFASSDYAWLNGRGDPGLTVQIQAYLPASVCLSKPISGGSQSTNALRKN